MTEKQKLKSIEKKMATIQKNNLEIDFKLTTRSFLSIENYYKLDREHFFLKFEMEHCSKCGKKL
jgi:hypothetical protein